MRQILVQVPLGYGSKVKEFAAEAHAISTASMEGERDGMPVDVVITHLSNRRVETFVERVERLRDVHISFYPMGVLALKPPSSEAAKQVTDVQFLSPIEVFLAGHQSVGSWPGFLGYAAAAGAVVWVGLYVGSVYLLTAAMLVAPYAGPAMNSAIATASGEKILLRQSILRYVVALAVTIAVTFALTLMLGPEAPSARMIEESQISAVAVILPLVAGASGALFLLTSERSSLVSGAAVGLLVAASLAPPAGLAGMATALGRWDMVGSASFILALQLVGIHLTGAVTFRLLGLSHQGIRRGERGRLLFPVGLAISIVLLAGLFIIQFRDPVHLNRRTLVNDVAAAIEREISVRNVQPEYIRAEFMQTEPARPPVLLAEIFVREPPDRTVSLDSTSRALAEGVRQRLGERWPEISPLLDFTWVSGP